MRITARRKDLLPLHGAAQIRSISAIRKLAEVVVVPYSTSAKPVPQPLASKKKNLSRELFRDFDCSTGGRDSDDTVGDMKKKEEYAG